MKSTEDLIHGIKWNSLEKISTVIFGFVVPVILARLLSPLIFGLFAMAIMFLNLTDVLTDLGIHDAVIRRKSRDILFESTIFWLNIFVSIIVFLLLIVAASPIASFFSEPIVENLIYILSINVLFKGITGVPLAVLKQQMAFNSLTKLSVASRFISSIVGIGGAIQGLGVWSLVVMQITDIATRMIFILVTIRWQPKIYFNIAKVKEVSNFMIHMSASKIIGQVVRRVDWMIIGKFLTTEALGIYSKSINFIRRPMKIIGGSITDPLYSHISKIRDDINVRSSAYLMISQINAMIYYPLFLCMSLLGEPIIILLFGEQWSKMIPIVTIFSLATRFGAQGSMNTLFLKALGKSSLILKYTTISSSIVVLSFVVGVKWGAIGITAAYTFVTIPIVLTITFYMSRILKINTRDLIANELPVLKASIIMFIVMFFSLKGLEAIRLDYNWIRLVISLPIGIIIYLNCLRANGVNAYNYIIEKVLSRKKMGFWKKLLLVR